MAGHTDEIDELPGRCSEVDEHGMGRCVLDADHEPDWLGVVHHAWERFPDLRDRRSAGRHDPSRHLRTTRNALRMTANNERTHP